MPYWIKCSKPEISIAMQLLRQIEFSLFDFKLHAKPPPQGKEVQQLLDTIRADVCIPCA